MKKKVLLPLASAILVSSGFVLAEQPSYSFVEAGFVRAEVDGQPNADPDGGFIDVSYQFSDMFYAAAGYSAVDGGPLDSDSLSGSLGAIFDVGMNTNAYAEVALLNESVSFYNDEEDDTGWGAAVGVRSNVTNAIELTAGIGYADVFSEGTTLYNVGGNVRLTDMLRVGVDATMDDDSNEVYSLFARITF